jgi:hypothetical protein
MARSILHECRDKHAASAGYAASYDAHDVNGGARNGAAADTPLHGVDLGDLVTGIVTNLRPLGRTRRYACDVYHDTHSGYAVRVVDYSAYEATAERFRGKVVYQRKIPSGSGLEQV